MKKIFAVSVFGLFMISLIFVGYQNVPGKVVDAENRLLRGSFNSVPSATGSWGDVGGACLIFRPGLAARTTCHSHVDCPKSVATSTGGSIKVYGYCVPAKYDVTPQATCWFKRQVPVSPAGTTWTDAPGYCVKGARFPGFRTVGLVERFPLGSREPTDWRVLTCQNNPRPDGPSNNCSKGMGVYGYGPIRRVAAEP